MYKKFEIKIILSNFTGQNRKIKTTIDMEIKKTEKANLENKKLLFTEIGLIISLLIVFIAFEWTQAEVKVSNLEDTTQVVTEEEIIPITQETPPPPPSAPKIPILSDQIDIVDDEIKIDDDMFMNLEDDASIGVEIMDYVEVQEEVVEEEAIPFQLVEEKPSFQGGDANQFSKWVNSRLVYPEIAKENGVQGRVTLQFTVEKDGSVTKVKVLRGVDPSLDKEAVRVVSMSPKWKPGKQRDRAVPVTYTFPVIFQLR
jgi:protein TonB